MHVLLELSFLFIYIYFILLFKIIDVSSGNLFRQQFALLLLIYPYAFILYLIDRIVRGCWTDLYMLSLKSVMIALICMIGYSMYFTYYLIELSHSKQEVFESSISTYLGISMTIIILITIYKVLGLLLYNVNDC